MIVLSALLISVLFLPAAPPAASTCYGTTSNGALHDGCKLPSSGANFSSYSRLGGGLGRTWVHCTVRRVIVDSYADLESSHPEKRFVHGETGWEHGGSFAPHKTHQNGLSVDFMVPVVDKSGSSVPLPTGILNKFGYNIEFSERAEYKGLFIDFEAMAAHIAAIRKAAESAGIGVGRVIFDPKLQPRLHSTSAWPKIKGLDFSTRRSWVRHDEHYHIDFDIPCRPMSARSK